MRHNDHDYKWHGTTTSFAALNVLQGTVIGRCMQRHRRQECICFLDAVERVVPAGRILETIVDKHPKEISFGSPASVPMQ